MSFSFSRLILPPSNARLAPLLIHDVLSLLTDFRGTTIFKAAIPQRSREPRRCRFWFKISLCGHWSSGPHPGLTLLEAEGRAIKLFDWSNLPANPFTTENELLLNSLQRNPLRVGEFSNCSLPFMNLTRTRWSSETSGSEHPLQNCWAHEHMDH